MSNDRPLCSVTTCTDQVKTLKSGLCSAHYQRARAHDGDPLAGRTAPGVALSYFYMHLMTITADCKIWPYTTLRSGASTYGKVWINGTWHTVHTLACEAFNGPRPPGLDAAHNCGKHLCWNGSHLRWDTRKGNMADQLIHGTRNSGERNGRAKLTAAQALEIRARYDTGETAHALSQEFGIALNHVQAIARRAKWKHLK